MQPTRSRTNVRLTDVDSNRTSTERLRELGRQLHQRPQPPRGLRFREGTLYWDAPATAGNVTHYRVYLDTESNHFATVPGTQKSITGISGARVFVSSYNEISRFESRKAILNEVVWAAQGRLGGAKTHREIQAAIDGLPREGGEVFLAPGEWLIGAAVNIPATKPGVRLIGSGESTIIKRKQDIATGYGVINVFAENVVLANFMIDGEVTTSVGIPYGTAATSGSVFHSGGINGDPIHPTLADNTSIRIHGGASGVLINNVKIQHTGGYAILICTKVPNTTDEDISDVIIRGCRFENNRPHQFGDTGDLVYGAWTGGILYRNDGASNAKKVRNLTVTGNSFYRCNGNCVWGHALGFTTLNEHIEFTGNTGLDLGLDFLMPGNVIGGVVANNACRRIGYTHQTDEDTAVPKYYWSAASGLRHAVAYDTTGEVKGVNYVNNAAISVNGGLMDCDGLHECTIAGNTLEATPDAGTAQYTEDQCSSYGRADLLPANTNLTKGINLSSSYHPRGSANIAIENNVIRNCGTNAISLGGSTRCLVAGNKIYHRASAFLNGRYAIPVVLFGLVNGAANTMLPAENVVSGNLIDWDFQAASTDPTANFCIVESDVLTTEATGGTATIAGPNYIHGNTIIGDETKNHGEFRKSSNSTGSVARAVFPTNDPAGANKSQAILQREGFGASAATKIYTEESGTTKQRVSIIDVNNYMNVSDNGGVGTGGVVTGDRTSAAFNDTVFTSHLVADGFIAVYGATETGPPVTTYDDDDANILDANAVSPAWGLIRFNEAAGQFEQSVSTTGTAPNKTRVWSALGATASTASPFTLSPQATPGLGGQLNLAGEGPYNAVTLDNYQADLRMFADQILLYPQISSGAGLNVIGNGYVEAESGFYTPDTATNAIQAPNGGVLGKYLIASTSLTFVEDTAENAGLSASGQSRFYMDSTSKKVRLSQNGGAYADLAVVAGSNTQVQYNASGALGAASSFVFNPATAQMTVTCGSGVSGINVLGGYMTSAQGYVSANAVYNCFNNNVGGADLRSATLRNYLNLVGVAAITPTSGDAFSPGVASQIWHDSSADRTRISEGYGLIVDAPALGVSAAFAGLTLSNGYISSYGGYTSSVNSIDSFQNSTGGANFKAVEADYLALPGFSSQPTTVSGHSPTLKIWHNSSSSRLEVGVSIYCPGVSCEGNSLGGNLFRYWNGASYVNGASGSFTTVDGKTVTVNGGIITSIV